MHEWALAEGVISTLLNFMNKEKLERIIEANIIFGELQQVDIDAFKYALEELSKDTPLRDTKFIFTIEKAEFRCRVCGHKWSFEQQREMLDEDIAEAIHFVPELAHSFIKCPNCGSTDFEVVKGRGVYIGEITVE